MKQILLYYCNYKNPYLKHSVIANDNETKTIHNKNIYFITYKILEVNF